MTLRLSTHHLDAIERHGIHMPHYDRAGLPPRILHVGVGGFHRAHLALYADELAEAGTGFPGGDRRLDRSVPGGLSRPATANDRRPELQVTR